LSAIQEVQKELEIPVHALITMKDLMDFWMPKAKKRLWQIWKIIV
jgi:orotate phosphoribosyltransferase